MIKRLTLLGVALLVFGCMTYAADKAFTGVVSDNHCGAKHAVASEQAATCIAKCVSGGAKYVLVSKGKVYQLDPQDKVGSDLAGKSVRVTGTATEDTITVTSIEEHAPAKKEGA